MSQHQVEDGGGGGGDGDDGVGDDEASGGGKIGPCRAAGGICSWYAGCCRGEGGQTGCLHPNVRFLLMISFTLVS